MSAFLNMDSNLNRAIDFAKRHKAGFSLTEIIALLGGEDEKYVILVLCLLGLCDTTGKENNIWALIFEGDSYNQVRAKSSLSKRIRHALARLHNWNRQLSASYRARDKKLQRDHAAYEKDREKRLWNAEVARRHTFNDIDKCRRAEFDAKVEADRKDVEDRISAFQVYSDKHRKDWEDANLGCCSRAWDGNFQDSRHHWSFRKDQAAYYKGIMYPSDLPYHYSRPRYPHKYVPGPEYVKRKYVNRLGAPPRPHTLHESLVHFQKPSPPHSPHQQGKSGSGVPKEVPVSMSAVPETKNIMPAKHIMPPKKEADGCVTSGDWEKIWDPIKGEWEEPPPEVWAMSGHWQNTWDPKKGEWVHPPDGQNTYHPEEKRWIHHKWDDEEGDASRVPKEVPVSMSAVPETKTSPIENAQVLQNCTCRQNLHNEKEYFGKFKQCTKYHINPSNMPPGLPKEGLEDYREVNVLCCFCKGGECINGPAPGSFDYTYGIRGVDYLNGSYEEGCLWCSCMSGDRDMWTRIDATLNEPLDGSIEPTVGQYAELKDYILSNVAGVCLCVCDCCYCKIISGESEDGEPLSQCVGVCDAKKEGCSCKPCM